jgi:ABC-type spermidine/putrescine transport system permease subunit I
MRPRSKNGIVACVLVIFVGAVASYPIIYATKGPKVHFLGSLGNNLSKVAIDVNQ